MKKRITAIVFACVLVLVSALPAFAVPAPPYSGTVADERAYPLLVDDADILSDYDEQRLLTKLESISTKWDMDVAIVTIENLDSRDIEAYTDDFYDYYGYGCGDNHNWKRHKHIYRRGSELYYEHRSAEALCRNIL